MKNRIRLLPLIIALVMLLSVFPVFAEDAWSNKYYRTVDKTESLNPTERQRMEDYLDAFVEEYHIDLAMIAITSDKLGDEPAVQFAEEYYEYCEFGYGEDHTGFQVIYEPDTERFTIVGFGEAETMIDQRYLEMIIDSAPAKYEKYGVFGVMYTAYLFVKDYIVKYVNPTGAVPDKSLYDTVERVGEDSEGDLPAWYPVDIESFEFYSDPTAPRVVDNADILSDDEEERLAERISAVSEEIGKDVVIFTDNSSYGFSHAVYAADFYDFNGYGVGDDREGICLMVCMEPGNRGWWACCTGPDMMEKYTEEYANDIDDVLYEYMAAGDYADGIGDWIENIRSLCLKGFPFAPEWIPNNADEFERFHAADASRVIDDANFFDEDEAEQISEAAAELSEKLGYDVVVATARTCGSLSQRKYAELLYKYNGYGLGEDFDGIELVIFGNGSCITHAEGKGLARLTDVNLNRLESNAEAIVDYESENSGKSALDWLNSVGRMEKTGRVPRSAKSWTYTGIAGFIAGLIIAGIMLSIAKKRMDTPKVKTDANAYLVRNSLSVIKVADNYLYSKHSRIYSPLPKETSSSSSSSGRSSYSSSYSGSSGSSHSGSGRSF